MIEKIEHLVISSEGKILNIWFTCPTKVAHVVTLNVGAVVQLDFVARGGGFRNEE
jgi:hypothetical protein